MKPKFNATTMGDAKRRKEALGDQYGKDTRIFPWLPITKKQAEKFSEVANRSAWIGIGFLIATWLTVRFIGPALNLWQLS